MKFNNIEGEPLKPGTEVGCFIGPMFCKCKILNHFPSTNEYQVNHKGIFMDIPASDIWIVKGT